jgi:hypothetical protein
MIEAAVKGTAARPYTVRIVLQQRDGKQVSFRGTCSCPVGFDCKHVAAALFAARGAERHRPVSVPQRALTSSAAPVMPPEVADWLRQFALISEDQSEDYPADVRQRVIYVLQRVARPAGTPTLHLAAFSVTLRKDSSFGAGRLIQAQSGTARYLRPSDKAILRRLERWRHAPDGLLRDEDAPELIRQILATGRARWASLQGTPLREGPVRLGQLAWCLQADGRQNPVLQLEGNLLGVALPAPWYVDPVSGEMNAVDLGVPMHVAARLLLAPPIPAEAAPLVAAELKRRLTAPAVALPMALDPPETLRGPPVPQLLLTAGRLPPYAAGPYGRRGSLGFVHGELDLPAVQLGFRYGPVLVPHSVRRAAYAGMRPDADVVALSAAPRRRGGARSGRAPAGDRLHH